jgi:hypothetical protein
MTNTDAVASFKVTIPYPKDVEGLPRGLTHQELLDLASRRVAAVIAQSGSVAQVLGVDAMRHAQLIFAENHFTVIIPVPSVPLFDRQSVQRHRKSAARNLLASRNDQYTLPGVAVISEAVIQQKVAIQALANILNKPDLNASQAIACLAKTPAAVRSLLVSGDTVDVDVDGRQVQIGGHCVPRSLEFSDSTWMSIDLTPEDDIRKPVIGRIVDIEGGKTGVCRVGGYLPLGFMQERQFERLALEMARLLQVRVLVQVRLAVSVSTLKPLTAEVLSVENTDEIWAAAPKRDSKYPGAYPDTFF